MTTTTEREATDAPTKASSWGDRACRATIVILCVLHGLAIWVGMGGRSGIASEWPPLRADHGMHFHHGLTTRQFLLGTGITAGYDPSFMAGYAMSIVSDASSTLTDLTMLTLPGRPALAYKLHVLIVAASLPWLMTLAALSWNAKPSETMASVLLYLAYFWTDYAVNFVEFGMLNYLISVPLGLLAVSGLTAYLDRGGFARWAWATAACSFVFLSHPISPMIMAPAGLLAYAVAAIGARRRGSTFSASRHVGLWVMVPLILIANAFWLVPGLSLGETKGVIRAFFSHSSESVLSRVAHAAWTEPPIESLLLGLAPVGLVAFFRREGATAAAGLGGFLAVGFGWGYLAGFFPALDELQPGRHTYACFAASSLAAGWGLGAIFARLREPSSHRLDLWAAPILILVGVRMIGPGLIQSVQTRLVGRDPFVSSQVPPAMLKLVSLVREHVKPGERLLYEYPGSIPGSNEGEPYQGRNPAAVLPWMTGVEVLGSPYPYIPVKAGFTQFGEGMLFGKEDWNRDQFTRYARVYRPAAIACWSRKSRQFCRSNPDLIEIVEDAGPILLGRVKGFEGAAIQGKATVEAYPGRLVVRNAEPGPDGLVILRYHAVPHLRATPPTAIEPVSLEEDPVPFIGLRTNSRGPITLEMVPPPRSWLSR